MVEIGTMKSFLLLVFFAPFIVSAQIFSRPEIRAYKYCEKSNFAAAEKILNTKSLHPKSNFNFLRSLVEARVDDNNGHLKTAQRKYTEAKSQYMDFIQRKRHQEPKLKSRFNIDVSTFDAYTLALLAKRKPPGLVQPFKPTIGDTSSAESIADIQRKMQNYADSTELIRNNKKILAELQESGLLPNHVTLTQRRTGPNNQDLEVTLEYGDSTSQLGFGSFEPGVYSTTMSSRVLTVFCGMLKSFFEKNPHVPLYGIRIKITGSADGKQIVKPIYYGRPLKNIQGTQENFGNINNETFNNLTTNQTEVVNLQPGDQITSNAQLAFLRAYQVKEYLIQISELSKSPCTINVETRIDTGGIYRKVTTVLYMKDAYKFDYDELLPYCNKISDNSSFKGELEDPLKILKEQLKPSEKIPYRKYIAITIGVSDYKNLSLNKTGLKDLQYGEKDARDFENFLKEEMYTADWEFHTFLGEQASCNSVGAKLPRIFEDADTNDVIYFFFSGHGIAEPQRNKDAIFLLYDYSEKNLAANLSLNDDLLDMVTKCKAKHIVLFLDACKSGSITLPGLKGSISPDLNRKLGAQRGLKAIICSTTGNESSWEGKGTIHNGLFTHFLLLGLRGSAKDSNRDDFVNLGELYDYLSDMVSETSQNPPYERRQTPWLLNVDNPDYYNFPLAKRIK